MDKTEGASVCGKKETQLYLSFHAFLRKERGTCKSMFGECLRITFQIASYNHDSAIRGRNRKPEFKVLRP